MKKYKGAHGFNKAIDTLLQNTLYSPGTVDDVLGKEQIKLLPETCEYLYTQYTSLRVRYRRGSRPFLEKILFEAILEAKEDLDKIIVLLNWCVNIEKNFPTSERNAKSGFYRSPDDFL